MKDKFYKILDEWCDTKPKLAGFILSLLIPTVYAKGFIKGFIKGVFANISRN